MFVTEQNHRPFGRWFSFVALSGLALRLRSGAGFAVPCPSALVCLKICDRGNLDFPCLALQGVAQ